MNIFFAEVIKNMADKRFLLIKAWSHILWSDVEHVLSQLLIAELTDRIPVVYWPTHCINNGYIHTNGFELYFEPVSDSSVFDIAKPEYTFFPPVWDENNILIDDPTKDTWVYRNLGDMLTCSANVLIGDVYFDIYNIIPFIRKDHPAYGMTVREIYRYLFRKYIHIKPDIKIEIQGFYNSWLKDEIPTLAVHVCKVDNNVMYVKNKRKVKYKFFKKSYEKNIPQRQKRAENDYVEKKIRFRRLPWRKRILNPNEPYHDEIKKYIERYNVRKIFLVTDSEDILEEYRKKYGAMITATECPRIDDEKNIHWLDNPMVKRRQGIDILKDTYIAAKCEFFIGNDFSSLSQSIVNLKDWPKSNVRLLYRQVGKRKYPINTEIVTREHRFHPIIGIKDFVKKILKKKDSE